MRDVFRVAALAALMLASQAQAQAPDSGTIHKGAESRRLPLPPELRQAMAKTGLPVSALALQAFPLDRRSQVLSLNGEAQFQAGSLMKLLTAVVALDRLGPASRGRTDLLIDGPVQGEFLNGPLYLRGGADAELDWGALWLMLRQLREQEGLRELRGGVVVDRSLFRPARPELGQPPFDASPEWPYNVIPDALHLNSNLLGYLLSADTQRLSARSVPAWPGLQIDVSGMSLVDKPCVDWEQGWRLPEVRASAGEMTVLLKGSFPRQCQQRLNLNLLDRQWLTEKALRQIWAELGGTLGGEVREAATPATARVLVSHRDRPLGELLRSALKQSDNPVTRLVYLRLGASAASAEELTAQAAERVVREWLAAKGIADAGLVLENGSGLSRSERIAPAQLAAVLAAAWDSPLAPELLSGLPLAGVDGTLTRRFKGSVVEGRARLKTASLRNVVGVAGFVQDAQQRHWVLVALVNHEEAAARGRPVLDALVEWLVKRP